MTVAPADPESSNIAGMTAPMNMLDLRAVAEAVEISYHTMQNYRQKAERRRRENASRPGDLPPADEIYGGSPVWRPATIDRWLHERPGRGAGGGRSFKEDAGYQALHLRVQAARGKPSLCAWCSETEGGFEWANISGNYKDVNDYERLCTSCHRVYDATRIRKAS